MARTIDWNAVGAALFEFLFCGIFGLMMLGQEHGLSFVFLPIALIAFVTLIQKLIGVVFDREAGTVRFFSFLAPPSHQPIRY